MKYLKVRFDARKLVMHVLCIIFSVIIQYTLIMSFISEGLTYTTTPLETLNIILFLLIPLNVILILLLSWLHLTRNLFTVPLKASAGAKARISDKSLDLAAGGRLLHSTFLGALSTILLFCFLSFIMLALMCPFFLYGFATNLYWSSGLFRSLIESSKQINSSLINAIAPLAISFRNSLWGLIKPLNELITTLNVTWKYLICQNVAAWSTAITILAYVKYRGRVRKRAV